MENLWALIKGNLPVFVMFYASWCPHCRKMLPIVRKLENNKHLNLQCFDIDDPANRRLVDYYQVQAVPLMMIYKAGEQLWRWNGEIEEEELMQTLKMEWRDRRGRADADSEEIIEIGLFYSSSLFPCFSVIIFFQVTDDDSPGSRSMDKIAVFKE
ncbi:thioredoxin family protein [Odoribacter splanchnicus]|uniref:thioredoxin family protein n=1 Tax=Odoribacter splanchnicus TaxID=28118 RepID=UPI0018993EEE|nr:thioredoxin family protein [Odoribacter splanchnicus]